MATERTQNQGQGQGQSKGGKGTQAGSRMDGAGSTGNEELLGVTEDGEEVSATLDDDQGGRSSGQRGGSGNFANDRERASEAGRKGGRH